MKVRYWWSEDGETEICERAECVLEETIECYHCMSILPKGVSASVLTALNDKQKYIMCVVCADRSTQKI